MRGIWVVALLAICFAGWTWAADEGGVSQEPASRRPANEPSERTRRGCENELQTLRSAVELYKLQHADKYPTTSGEPNADQWQWELLTGTSTSYDGKQVGPYLQEPAFNPVAKSSGIVNEPEKGAGWLLDKEGQISPLDRSGEKYDPRPTRNSPRRLEGDRVGATKSMLQVLRSVVELYKLQHNDRYPTTSGRPVAAEWSWKLLTTKTPGTGGREVGPYLQSAPENPLTGSSSVVARPEKGAGWLLTPDGKIYALADDPDASDNEKP